MKAAADFTRQQCSAFLIPIFTTILQVGFLAIWITAITYIFSSGEIEQVGDTPFAFVKWNRLMQGYALLYAFGLFW